MVHLTVRTFIRKYNHKFVDKLRVYVRGGSGGISFPSLGGIGGHGGDVYVVAAKDNSTTLRDMKKTYTTQRFIADNGENSSRNKLFGLKGASIYVQVPHGITIVDADENKIIGDILKPEDKLLVATGGKGASSRNNYQQKKGKWRNLWLDMKVIADVGFVGFPNAGKSTLLTALSNATPKVANYPFTTMNPEIGVISYDDFRSIKLADLPGLIEGAFMNKGRGHSFLKHVERTDVILYVVDVNGFQLSPRDDFRNAFETILYLTKELELFDESLLKKDKILAINKMDSENSSDNFEILINQLNNYESHLDTIPKALLPEDKPEFKHIIPISAQEGSGTEELKLRIREVLDKTAFEDNKHLRIENKGNNNDALLDKSNQDNERKLIL